ncbi:hypothetical protein PybrP1_003702 [[Pythium] brassicae (nom. inval.)]|nr:hypothetical protein PybrP1_003702 [[Pythium] brassicae (nom. inval.)]
MRVLLVNAYPKGNARGAERFDAFRQHALRVVKELEKTEVTEVEVVERSRNELDEFLFEMHSEFASPHCITNFDRLDFVLVDGDANALPWAPPMRKLALLTKMCMMTGKCVFASGLGAALLAYVCATGGEHFRVMNNDGKGSLIDDIQAIPPPPAAVSVAWTSSSAVRAQDVLLDTKSGDFFVFTARERCWVPKGNTGLVMHSSDHARDYGAKVNAARAGTKPAQVRERLSHSLCLSKRGDTKCCVRLEHANHVLFTSIPHREFVANCKSKWDLDEVIASTGTNRYRVLLDSSRGPMLVEFGNCVGTHFLLAREYPESGKLLRNFVLAKFEELKVHAHIDRSYVSAISGSSRLKDRLNQAQTKSVMHSSSRSSRAWGEEAPASSRQVSASSSHGVGVEATTVAMAPGRTSPKRCRPVSAGPSRSAPKATHPTRTIKTSRSAYPPTTSARAADELAACRSFASGTPVHASNGVDVGDGRCAKLAFESASASDNNAGLAGISQQFQPRRTMKMDTRFGSDSPEVDAASGDAANQKAETPRRRCVRVLQRNELEKPYCAVRKFDKMRDEDKQSFYSVVNDAPYVGAAEREAVERQQNKLKWTAGPFRTAVGNATTHAVPIEAGIFAREPFVQRNTPFYIIQRRELDRKAPPLKP